MGLKASTITKYDKKLTILTKGILSKSCLILNFHYIWFICTQLVSRVKLFLYLLEKRLLELEPLSTVKKLFISYIQFDRESHDNCQKHDRTIVTPWGHQCGWMDKVNQRRSGKKDISWQCLWGHSSTSFLPCRLHLFTWWHLNCWLHKRSRKYQSTCIYKPFHAHVNLKCMLLHRSYKKWALDKRYMIYHRKNTVWWDITQCNKDNILWSFTHIF